MAFASLISGVVGGTPAAQAASNGYVGLGGWSSSSGQSHDVWYAYAKTAAEVVQLAVSDLTWVYSGFGGSPEIRLEVWRPSGTRADYDTVSGFGGSGLASGTGEAGVWKLQVVAINSPPSQSWVYRQQIRVLSAADSSHVPGRVWAKKFTGAQALPAAASLDFDMYVVAEDGAVFETKVRDYDGINSHFGADGLGMYWSDGCEPIGKSRMTGTTAYPMNKIGANALADQVAATAQCAAPVFNLFSDPPAADLPARMDYWGHAGDDGFIKPVYTPPSKPNPQLAKDDDAPALAPYQGVSGTLGLDGFRGEYQVSIDVDGDGLYTGSADIVQDGRKTKARGDVSWTWNGQDGNGAPVTSASVGVQVKLIKGDEYYQVFGDTEKIAGGVQIRQLAGYAVAKNGGQPVWPMVHWDDSDIVAVGVNPIAALAGGAADVKTPAAGLSTEGFKHAWSCHDPSYPGGERPYPEWTSAQESCWGNNALVTFATWDDLSKDLTLQNEPLLLSRSAAMVSKSGTLNPAAGAAGAETRTIAYTVKVKNTSDPTGLGADAQASLAFTASDPLVVTDNLPSHVSNWTYLATAYDKGSAPAQASASASGGKMTWRGPLKAGETAAISYRVTVDAGFAPERTNAAAITGCPDGGRNITTACDTARVANTTPLPGLKIEKSVDTAGLHQKGHTAAYTITLTNVGKAAFTSSDPAYAYDDLTKALDDATFAASSLKATAGTATWDAAAKRITWAGPLAVGASAKITYTLAYDPRLGSGGGDLLLENTAWIRPVDVIDLTPGERVGTATPGSDLHVAKSVDVETVRPGQLATYMIDLHNTRGKTAAPVSLVDHLDAVLDDADFVAGSLSSTDPAVAASFDAAAKQIRLSGALKAGGSAKIVYQVKVKTAARGDNRLANRVGDGSGDCREDDPLCTVTPVQAHTVAKTAKTDSGLAPKAGEKVHYAVVIVNTGSVAAEIVERDNLQWVADDADVSNVKSDYGPIKAVLKDKVVEITGLLEVGDTATITYDATVRERDRRGDQVLTNVVYPGEVCDQNGRCAPPAIPTERPTCSPALGLPCATNLVRDLRVAKTASPPVQTPGGLVDYKIILESVGTAAVAVEQLDVMRWVFDDATLVDALTPRAGPLLLISDASLSAFREVLRFPIHNHQNFPGRVHRPRLPDAASSR
ncbi:MAG: DUF11 domain-containing protein [Bifidobacteriaceae bacterium]|nr:DUF11 domain-containing protein [Bifidobacteriaceae bacterium]